MQKDKNLPPIVSEVIKNLEKAKNVFELNNVLVEACNKNISFTQLHNVLFKYREYYFNCGLKGYTDNQVKNLKMVNKLGIKSAPVLVKYVNKLPDATVVVTRIDGADMTDVVTYDSMKSKINDKVKRTFFNDMKLLIESRYSSNDLANTTSNWFTTADAERMLLINFGNLEEIEADQVESALEAFKELLDKK